MTWSAQSALVAGWTLQAQLHPEDLLGRSSRASGLETPITGSLLSGAWHRVGDTGPPYGILLSAQNANLVSRAPRSKQPSSMHTIAPSPATTLRP